MSEAEVTLTYRELPATIVYYGLVSSIPVIALFVLLCCMCGALTASAVDASVFSNISVFNFLLLVLAGSAVGGIIITSDKTIFLARDGISLPFLLCPALKLRSQHSWSDLAAVRLLPGGRRGVLALEFQGGKTAKLKLDTLPAEQVENLIVSMEVWAGGTETFPALLEARLKLNEQGNRIELHGYTEMWEEELSRRFGATNFIPLEPGAVVRDLTIERQLAFGGMSAIYLVVDKKNLKYVLKEAVIPPDADGDMRKVAERMLEREANILASLSHPSIARVLDHFLESGRHYIMMELIEGADLRRLVKEHGRQSEADVEVWAKALLQILEYLHGQSPPVVHRDLSPDNLMLTENGELCLIDFGAANHFVGTATGTLIGKQAYIAPEQLRGKAEPRSDIYAFGCTLFFLLTGEDPEPLAVSRVRETNNSVSSKLANIIEKCTEQDENDRPSSAAEVLALFNDRALQVSHG